MEENTNYSLNTRKNGKNLEEKWKRWKEESCEHLATSDAPLLDQLNGNGNAVPERKIFACKFYEVNKLWT